SQPVHSGHSQRLRGLPPFPSAWIIRCAERNRDLVPPQLLALRDSRRLSSWSRRLRRRRTPIHLSVGVSNKNPASDAIASALFPLVMPRQADRLPCPDRPLPNPLRIASAPRANLRLLAPRVIEVALVACFTASLPATFPPAPHPPARPR